MITSVTAEVAYNTTVSSIKNGISYRELQHKAYAEIDSAIKNNRFYTVIDLMDTVSFEVAYPLSTVLQDELSGLGYNAQIEGITEKHLVMTVSWFKYKK